jgi:porin
MLPSADAWLTDQMVPPSIRTRFASLLSLLASTVAAQGSITAPPGSWLTPTLTYDASATSGLSGGARTGSTYLGNLHMKLTAQGDSLGMPGTSAFADLLTIHGGRPSRLVGDAQGTSNLDGPTGTQIEELWVQHNFAGSSTSLLLGIYDLNSEFYRLTAAGLFQNSSFGIGPEFGQSGLEGPSIFPRTSAALRLAVKPTAETVVRVALIDGVPVVRPDGSRGAFQGGDGLLLVGEVAWLSRGGQAAGMQEPASRDRIGRFSSLAPYDDKLAVGTWHYTGRYPDLSDVHTTGAPVSRHGSMGAYVVGERLLVGDAGHPGRRLAAFAQVGLADARTNRFGSYVGAGVVGSGWGPMKEADQIGIAVAHARNGNHYANSPQGTGDRRAETTFELSYLRQLSRAVSLQPDLQYVIHPNTERALSNALVFSIRLELAL